MTRYRARGGRRQVVDVRPGSLLEAMVANSGAYELLEDQADELELVDVPVGPPAEVGEIPATDAGDVDPVGTLPPVPPAPAAVETGAPAPAPVDPTAEAILAAAYEVDTAEGVNAYLDQHPYAAELVLEHEAANKARKGILHGRHGTAPADAEPVAE